MKRYHLPLVFLLMILNLGAINVVGSWEIPRIFVDPPNVSGSDVPAPGSVLSLSINVSDIPEPGLWGYEFYMSLNSTVFPPIIPLNNMNFTTSAAYWITTVMRTSGVDSYGYNVADGNPSPGSDVGSYFARANSTQSQTAQITFLTEQAFTWSLGTWVTALLSFAYKIAGNSIAATGNSIGIRVIKPSGVIRTLIPTRSFGTIKSWTYNPTETAATSFDETGTYKFQLKVMLKTAELGVDKYVQVGWDDVGLELAPLSVSEGSFLTSDSRNAGRTYFSAEYSTQGYVYVADSLVAQPYIDGFPITGHGTLVHARILVGYGSATLDLYKTALLTLGDPPSYSTLPIYPYAAEDGFFSNEQIGAGLSYPEPILYGEVEPGVFCDPKLIVNSTNGETANETANFGGSEIVPEGLTEEYQRVDLLIVGDEEMTSKIWNFSDQQLDWRGYIDRQITYACYYLNTQFNFSPKTAVFATWHSDNSQQLGPQMLSDAMNQLGWIVDWNPMNEIPDRHDMLFNGVVVHALVVVTGQMNNGSLAGVANADRAAILIQPQYWWADDNLIQHEISHLYGAPDHDEENDDGYYEDCIMTYRDVYVGNHYDNGYEISLDATVSYMYVTHNYHVACFTIIFDNRFKYGVWILKGLPSDFNPDLTGGGGESSKVW